MTTKFRKAMDRAEKTDYCTFTVQYPLGASKGYCIMCFNGCPHSYHDDGKQAAETFLHHHKKLGHMCVLVTPMKGVVR